MLDYSAIAKDLDLIDAVAVLGSRKAKRAARIQWAIIFAAIKAENAADGLDNLSDADLLAELMA